MTVDKDRFTKLERKELRLWSFYTGGHDEIIVAQAITNGIISKTEISPALMTRACGK